MDVCFFFFYQRLSPEAASALESVWESDTIWPLMQVRGMNEMGVVSPSSHVTFGGSVMSNDVVFSWARRGVQ